MRKEKTSTTTASKSSTGRSKSGTREAKGGHAAQAQESAEAYHRRIAARAYELYEKRGRQDGRAMEDWLSAERQVADTSSR